VRARSAELVVCLSVAALELLAVWLVPRAAGDLYVAYAGGRDALDGKLGGMDDWSFANPGQTWINQNWGTHVLYYGVYRLGGPAGNLVLKGALLVLLFASIALLVRAHGVERPMAALVAGSVVLAGHAYIDLRPNLVSLTFSPLLAWLLLRRALWPAVLLLWLWSNMHGGFVFGLAMLALWCGLLFVRRPSWALVTAPAIAVALAGLANPFGLHRSRMRTGFSTDDYPLDVG